jgi:RNA:NAD 2'-phosphotransferase (TPT1/KptA family)
MKSVKDEDLLTPIDQNSVFKFPQVVHGTYKKVLEPVMRDGLCRMARNNIHMALGLPKDDGVISGMRNSAQIVVEINANQAVFDGVPMFVSENQVILSPGVNDYLAPRYFRSVYDIASGKYLH